jgi:hypothetical protein
MGAVVILAGALLTPLLLTTPASAAAPARAAGVGPGPITAVTCGPSAPDRDSGVSVVRNPESGFSGPAMRTGPGTNCGLLTRPPWGSTVSLNCYRFGDTYKGYSTWTAVHYGNYFGWINDYFLSGDGSFQAC